MSNLTTGAVDELDAPVINDAPLTALDRCDSCGAQAYVRVTLESGELLFCAHHAAEFKEKLAPKSLAWQDETDRLVDER